MKKDLCLGILLPIMLQTQSYCILKPHVLSYLDNNDILVDLRYETHEWVQVESDIATVGTTHFAQSELGDIVFIELEIKSIYARERCLEVSRRKTLGDLISPLSGEVLETNEVLEDDAEAVKGPLWCWLVD